MIILTKKFMSTIDEAWHEKLICVQMVHREFMNLLVYENNFVV